MKNVIVPIWPRHCFPTLSVNKIREHVVIDARPIPLTNLKLEYIQMFMEKAVISATVDIIRNERKGKFFRPR